MAGFKRRAAVAWFACALEGVSAGYAPAPAIFRSDARSTSPLATYASVVCCAVLLYQFLRLMVFPPRTADSDAELPAGRTFGRDDLAGAFPASGHDAGGDGEPPECVVCLEAIHAGDKVRKLPCGHSFHADCILDWWACCPKDSVQCPVCRSDCAERVKKHLASGQGCRELCATTAPHANAPPPDEAV